MHTRQTSFDHGPFANILAVNPGTPAADVLNHVSALLASSIATLTAGANAEETDMVWCGLYSVQAAYGLLQSIILAVEFSQMAAPEAGEMGGREHD